MAGRDIVLDLSDAQNEFVHSTATIVALIGPFGEGKCMRKGTMVIMNDGSVKKVEDIKVGDKLMGPDSKPRTVMALGRGVDDFYEIIPKRGESFFVNKAHILSLKRTKHCSHKPEKNVPWIVNISVEDYLKRSRTFRSSHLLYRVPVMFKKKEVPIDPYFLGVWLGDGNSHNTGITSVDKEVITYIFRHAVRIDQKIYKTIGTNRTETFITTGIEKGKNRLLSQMQGMKLIGNKHIPHIYKANSMDIRLQLLAGIIDTDGTPNRTSYQICQKSERLTDDILFLARSLGFAAYKKKIKKKCCNNGKVGEYFNITIDGDCTCIPTIVKKVPARKQKKNVLVTGIKEIKPVGREDYYGFILDKNHLYLLSDFTVTHNTYAGFWGLANHARKFQGRPMYGAIIRDTFENLKNQTAKSINEASYGNVSWSDGGKKMRFLNAEIDLYGIDDIASLSKLQGAEYSFIWLEEPAPIAAKENAGLREEVFTTALTRVGRQRDAIPRLQITMNPADEDHWTYKRLIFDPINAGGVTTEVFHIPYGSNKVLKDETRELVKQSYKDSPDLYERYVRGNFSFIQFGEAVTPEYNEKIHRSAEIFKPDPAREVFRFWDGGLNPTCVFMQISPRGRMQFMDTVRGENMGVKQLIETRIIPLINDRYEDVQQWRDIGDPSMAQREQSDSSQTAADVINTALGAAFEPGEKSWQNRREAMKEMFNRMVDGIPMFQLSHHDSILHRCFRGGWHYSKDPSGRVMRDKPVKDIHSHPGDAVSHGVARILLRPKMLDRLARIKQITKAKWGITGVSDVYREKPHRIYIK